MVLETVELGQDERSSPAVVQLMQEFVDLRSFGDGGRHDVFVGGEFGDPLVESAAPRSSPCGIDAGASGDRQQPVPCGAVGAIAVERRDGAAVGLLGQVLGVVAVAQVAAQIEYVAVGRDDELLERVAITTLGVEQQPGHTIHQESVCRGNSTTPTVDRHNVESRNISDQPGDGAVDPCAEYRATVSAALDGEASVADEAALERHLAECAQCAAFRDRSAVLTRTVRVRASAPHAAFVARVMSDARPARLGRTGWPRPVLAWCAIVIAVQSFAPLFLGDADGAPAHVARHVGASSIALACGLLYAAWRPHRAYGLLPFVGALTAATVIAAVVDTVDGRRSAFAEATHVAEIVGTVVLWIVAGAPGWDRLVSSLRPHRSGRGALRSTS